MKTNERDRNTIAVVGYREAVLPFLAVGADVFITDSADKARDAIIDCAERGYPVIFVPDDLLKELADVYQKYLAAASTSITSIPGKDSSSMFTRDRINSLIKKAIGIDLAGLGG